MNIVDKWLLISLAVFVVGLFLMGFIRGFFNV